MLPASTATTFHERTQGLGRKLLNRPFTHPSVRPSILPYTHPLVCQFIHPPVCLYFQPCVHPPISPHLCLSTYPLTRQATHPLHTCITSTQSLAQQGLRLVEKDKGTRKAFLSFASLHQTGYFLTPHMCENLLWLGNLLPAVLDKPLPQSFAPPSEEEGRGGHSGTVYPLALCGDLKSLHKPHCKLH